MSRLHNALRRLEAMNPTGNTLPGAAAILREPNEGLNGHAARQARRLSGRPAAWSHIIVDAPRNHPIREQFRFIEHRLRRLAEVTRTKRVLVTSSTPREGKTVVAANLAVTLACSSARVLLLDADMRGPGSQALYGLENSLGLADVLERRATLSEALLYLDEMKVHYIPSGRPSSSPADLVKSTRMNELLKEVDDFDWIVVDSPPIGAFADGLSLASQVDTVLLVARSGMTHKRDLEESLAALKDSKIAGVVLNAHEFQRKRDSYYSYYSQGKQS